MIDPRLEEQKTYPRAMQSYVMMLYEFVLELKPKKMLEIGVRKGQSTITTLMAMNMNKYGTLVSVDIKNRINILDERYEYLKGYWEFMKGDSSKEDTVNRVKNYLEEGDLYDILFIDGDHKLPVAQLDFDNYEKLVKPGGLILMHDVTNKNEDVDKVWETISYPKFCIDWGRAGAGVIPGFGIVKKPL